MTTMETQIDTTAPDREIRVGAILIGAFLLALFVWGSLVRLDAAAYGQGVVAVAGQRKAVQHREGGIVSEILIKEGERVKQGQLLIRLNGEDVAAEERALTSQYVRLLSQRIRLQAEETGSNDMTLPAEVFQMGLDDRAQFDAAMVQQRRELQVRSASLSAQRGALGQRVLGSGEQAKGYTSQSASAKQQLALIDEELKGLRPLAEKGFVSQTRLRALEREKAALIGQGGQLTASVGQAGNEAQESRIQMLEAERRYRERAAAELRDVDTRMGEVKPRLEAVRQQLARIEIRAPVAGSVVDLSVFTNGGVIAAGQKVMEIVPEAVALKVQARMSPDDSDDLLLSQKALIRFIGLHERNIPDLEGVVTRISADSLTDERTGLNYFSVEITVPESQLALIKGVRGSGFELRPGMPAEVIVPLRPRTALQYLFEPLTGAFWRSFREH